MKPGFRIKRSFDRPAKALIDAFEGIPVADIADNMHRIACMDSRIRLMNKGPLLGCAFTVRLRSGDNMLFHKAIDMAQPGDVLVVDVQGDLTFSIFGDQMTTWAQRRGIKGIVIDGAIRDYASISQMTGIPVFAAGIQGNGPFHHGGGEIGFAVTCGNQVVHPGDIIVGDEDGVLAIRPEDTAELAVKARATVAKSETTFAAIEAGTWDRSWVDKQLEALGCEYVD